MTEVAAGVVWEGAEALRQFLTPVDSLEPFPGNPRRGDVEAVRASLRRFGQVRPLLADGTRLVAGHHVRLAAVEEGWTHVAVIPHDFPDGEDRAYLLADNRTHDLGYDDQELLAEQLRFLAEEGTLAGTGYGTDDLDALLAAIHAGGYNGEEPGPPEADPMRRSEMRELVLLYSEAQLAQVEEWLAAVAQECGTGGASETVYAALELAVASIAAR